MINKTAEQNYERKLKELNGIEVPINGFRISDRALGTKKLCDCCGIVIENETEAGLAHVYSTGNQPHANLLNLLDDLLKNHRREFLQADIIGGYDEYYEMILDFLESQNIRIRNKNAWGMSNKNLIYIPKTKELILYSGRFPEGFTFPLQPTHKSNSRTRLTYSATPTTRKFGLTREYFPNSI